MIKNLIRLGAASFIWKKYKAGLMATATLLFYLWLVSFIHQDYLAFNAINSSQQLADNSGVGWTFIVKWLAWIAGIIVYVIYDQRNATSEKIPGAQAKADNPKKNRQQRSSKHSASALATSADPSSEQTDPFAALRDKKILRSKSDFIIEKNSPTDGSNHQPK